MRGVNCLGPAEAYEGCGLPYQRSHVYEGCEPPYPSCPAEVYEGCVTEVYEGCEPLYLGPTPYQRSHGGI